MFHWNDSYACYHLYTTYLGSLAFYRVVFSMLQNEASYFTTPGVQITLTSHQGSTQSYAPSLTLSLSWLHFFFPSSKAEISKALVIVPCRYMVFRWSKRHAYCECHHTPRESLKHGRAETMFFLHPFGSTVTLRLLFAWLHHWPIPFHALFRIHLVSEAMTLWPYLFKATQLLKLAYKERVEISEFDLGFTNPTP